MSNIVYFKSQATLSTEQNLSNLITLARDQVMLWSEVEGFVWEAPEWSTHWGRIRFIGLYERGLHSSKKPSQEQLMSASFIDFAKAYLRYTQHINRTKTLRLTVVALQLLEAALIELNRNADITKVAMRHFDRAAELVESEGFKDRMGIGSAIQSLAKNIGKWHITIANTRYWRHPFVGKKSYDSISKSDPDALTKKMPSDDALLAIAEIFAKGYSGDQDDEDIYTTCVTCLLLSAPMRINEILHFRVNPLREGLDSKGNKQLYITYWVPKNGCYVRKEVPEVLAGLTREAVRRLTIITEESRRLAIHMESNSAQFYRHIKCPAIPDDQVLTSEEAVQAAGFKSIRSLAGFIYRRTGDYRVTGWTLNSLWQLILAEHKERNPHFPYQVDPAGTSTNKPLKMSESLMCFRHMQLSTRNQTSAVLLAPMSSNFYAKRIESRDIQRRTVIVNSSVLVKHGYEGLTLRSHQLRHFLNTLAQEAGVSIDAITRWSTRASKTQSLVYMHQDPDRKARQVAEKQGLLPTQTTGQPITKDEYKVMEFGPIITTRYGICTHDYTLTPCNKHADCLNCSELLLCKGHRRSIQAITEERNQVAENLAAAKAEIDAGKRVASRWHKVHAETLRRLNQLIKVMTDPNIEGGSPVRIQGKDFSHQTRILENRAAAHLDATSEVLDFGHSDDVATCIKLLSEEDHV